MQISYFFLFIHPTLESPYTPLCINKHLVSQAKKCEIIPESSFQTSPITRKSFPLPTKHPKLSIVLHLDYFYPSQSHNSLSWTILGLFSGASAGHFRSSLPQSPLWAFTDEMRSCHSVLKTLQLHLEWNPHSLSRLSKVLHLLVSSYIFSHLSLATQAILQVLESASLFTDSSPNGLYTCHFLYLG